MAKWAFLKHWQHCIIGLAVLTACSACSPAFNASRVKKVTSTTSSSRFASMLSFLFVDWDTRAGIGYQPYGAANTGAQIISFNSKLYSFWSENGHVHASVYNGNDSAPNWTSLDGGLYDGFNINPSHVANAPFAAIFNSVLYVTWTENLAVRVARYSGDDSAPAWTPVDGGGLNYDLTKTTGTPMLTVMDNTTMFAVWYEADAFANNHMRVSSYDGTFWTLVDGGGAAGINFTPAGQTAFSTRKAAVCLNSKLYVTWQELNGGGSNIHLKVYDPAGPSWTWLDGGTTDGLNYSPGRIAIVPMLHSFNSKIYVTWSEEDAVPRNQVRITAYNPVGGTLTRIDGGLAAGLNYSNAQHAHPSDIFTFGSTLYLAWGERNAGGVGQVRLASYNGNDVAPLWTRVDGGGVDGLNDDNTADAGGMQTTIHDSKLYSTWQESIQTFVRVYNGNDAAPVWTRVLSQRRNIGINLATNFAVTPGNLAGYGGKIYSVFTGWDDSIGVYATMLKIFNGNATSPQWDWVTVTDSNINYNSSFTAGRPDITVFNSKLYATWDEENPVTQIRVLEYDPAGPTTTFVDGNALNGINFNFSRYAYHSRLAVVGSKLYATWIEDNNGLGNFQVRAAEFVPAGPSWTLIDGNAVNGLNYNPADAVQSSSGAPKPIEFNSKLYVAWSEYKGGLADQIRVRVYDPVGATWTFVDLNGVNGINYDNGEIATFPDLAVFDSKLYAIWQERNASGITQIRVKVYNGNDVAPAWTTVGGGATGGLNYSSAKNAETPKLVVFNSNLYATWSEQANGGGNAYQIRIAQYNGSDSSPSWQLVDSTGITGVNYDTTQWGRLPRPLSYNSKLYLFWHENNGAGYQGRVAEAQ